jgi:hypothetical protein
MVARSEGVPLHTAMRLSRHGLRAITLPACFADATTVVWEAGKDRRAVVSSYAGKRVGWTACLLGK